VRNTTSIFDQTSSDGNRATGEGRVCTNCSRVNDHSQTIYSMAAEIEDLQMMLSRATMDTSYQKHLLSNYKIAAKQEAIKTDLTISHLKVKVKLLQETLENKIDDSRELLENYDRKMIEMQTEIDVRDLKISGIDNLSQDSLNLDTMEDRIKYEYPLIIIGKYHNHRIHIYLNEFNPFLLESSNGSICFSSYRSLLSF